MKVFELSDEGNAQRFLDRFGDGLGFVGGEWWIWDGCWKKARREVMCAMAGAVCWDLHADAERETDPEKRRKLWRHAHRSYRKEHMDALLWHAVQLKLRTQEFGKEGVGHAYLDAQRLASSF